jgi:hypothetical protein
LLENSSENEDNVKSAVEPTLQALAQPIFFEKHHKFAFFVLVSANASRRQASSKTENLLNR